MKYEDKLCVAKFSVSVKRMHFIVQAVTVCVLLIGLPLLGALINGDELARYTEFPPLTQYTDHAPFSMMFFVVMSVMTLLVIVPFDVRVILTRIRNRKRRRATGTVAVQEGKRDACVTGEQPGRSRYFGKRDDCATGTVALRGKCNRDGRATLAVEPGRFPWWGWFGLVLSAVSWIMAWTRFEWFAPFQLFTFTPLWMGYILFVNGWTYRRSGECLLTDRPVYLLKLFVVSAVFWWFFEYLNRFVQNWYYIGLDDISPLRYFIFATLPFATVIPAVMSTAELLKSFPDAGAGLDHFLRIDVGTGQLPALAAMTVSVAGLASIAIFPNFLFPLLWLAPLFIITSLQSLFGEKTIFAPIRRGDWRRIYLLACSALICGFFWEMWNYESVAKWIYTVPYVTRFKLFEMPVLGFAGYIPFGLECAVIADWIAGGGAQTGEVNNK